MIERLRLALEVRDQRGEVDETKRALDHQAGVLRVVEVAVVVAVDLLETGLALLDDVGTGRGMLLRRLGGGSRGSCQTQRRHGRWGDCESRRGGGNRNSRGNE